MTGFSQYDQALILTPTARLARAEKRRQAEAQQAAGAQAWRAPTVLSFSAWIAQMRNEALMSGVIDRVPISTSQARMLWQQVIDTDVFIGEPRVYSLAERAWRTVHEYQLSPPGEWPEPLLSEDARRFQSWVQRFERLCVRHGVIDEWTFAARLPGWIADGRIEMPARIELKGFELPATPLQQSIFDALIRTGIELTGQPASAMSAGSTTDSTPETVFDRVPELDRPGLPLHCLAEPDDELRAAAQWARTRLEANPDQSIAIVVPDLGTRLARAERVFGQVFDPPGFALAESGNHGNQAWHASLGLPLAQWSLVSDALVLLRLDPARIEQSTAARVLASPFLHGWSEETDRRAGATANLMRRAPYAITGYELIAACKIAGASRLATGLERLRGLRAEHRDTAWPSDWVARFQTELEQTGFGRGRALDSREFQILGRWHELLEEFAALDVVVETPIRRGAALSLLSERATATTFRERNPGCPVELLGVEEALGSRFDALWITTLDNETWPGSARRDPLIPGPVQAAVPAASSDGRLARTRLELGGLLRAGGEVCASWSTGRDEPMREACRLIREPDVIELEPVAAPEPLHLERIDGDIYAPVLPDKPVRGGTGVLSDQSACPFRAFANRRLEAHELASPRPGLDAAARGSLIHKALEAFWDGLADRAALVALSPDALRERIHEAAEHALARYTENYRLHLSPTGRTLELRCTERALQRWLELEATRGEFRVSAKEQKISMQFSGLKLEGKIDRIDETPAGTVLIDYKTGRSGRNAWMPDPRIADPQLPAYALAMDPRPAALAFARIRPDELKFDGLCETDAEIPCVTELAATRGAWKEFENWSELMGQWQRNLDGLALSFQEGRAEVDPRAPDVCGRCHLHALCRIHERKALAEAEPEVHG